MKFCNRESELLQLTKIVELSKKVAQMTFVVGRRRIGKTSLLVKAHENQPCLYLFVAKKNEALLCLEFEELIKQQLQVQIFGRLKSFKDIFAYLMDLAKTKHFTVIIDEFQEFMSINPSIYSDVQNIWDNNKATSKINLILCGSVYSMMNKIFANAKEPLFGRATQRIHVRAFNVNTLKEILTDHAPDYTPEDLLAFYTITGGVAKYVELLVQASAFNLDTMLNELLRDNSLFLEEGRNVLIEEFGRDYGNYFSILSLIASGKTSRSEIESILEIQTGGFLDRLENEYNLIKKVRPILAKPNSRSVKYYINDNFLRFWFRFMYKNRSAIEVRNLAYVLEIVRRDYAMYSGHLLEKYFVEKLTLEKQYNIIGAYWARDNRNEIDIVAVNELEKNILFAEVKRNPSKINIDGLKDKSAVLIKQFQGFDYSFEGLSLEDM